MAMPKPAPTTWLAPAVATGTAGEVPAGGWLAGDDGTTEGLAGMTGTVPLLPAGLGLGTVPEGLALLMGWGMEGVPAGTGTGLTTELVPAGTGTGLTMEGVPTGTGAGLTRELVGTGTGEGLTTEPVPEGTVPLPPAKGGLETTGKPAVGVAGTAVVETAYVSVTTDVVWSSAGQLGVPALQRVRVRVLVV